MNKVNRLLAIISVHQIMAQQQHPRLRMKRYREERS